MTRKRIDNTQAVIDERRQTIARLYVQGYTQFAIAKVVGLCQQTISTELVSIRKEWLESRLKTYDERMSKELTALDMQESALWEAWYNSCKQEIINTITQKKVRPTRRKRKKNDPDESSDDLEITEEHSRTVTRQLHGDPRFMAEITKVRELRCKLMGLLEDEPLQTPVINIWQQLQDITSNTDYNRVEDRLLAIESKRPEEHTIVDARTIPDPPAPPTPQEDAIAKHLNLDWLDDSNDQPNNGQ